MILMFTILMFITLGYRSFAWLQEQRIQADIDKDQASLVGYCQF